jgi:hypothetical protein
MDCRTNSKKICVGLLMAAAVGVFGNVPIAAAQTTLDFEFFKTRVAPIFLKKRGEHARCYVCHQRSSGSSYQYLEKLPEGADFWTDAQLRTMMERISRLAVPGDPSRSKIVMYPLAPEQGGWSDGGVHSGGRKFADQNDPDWQTLSQWVQGAKAGQ